MKFDALTNEGEYFPPFYLDEILPKQLRTGRLKEWTAEERQTMRDRVPRLGLKTPFHGRTLREVGRDILTLAEAGLKRRARRNDGGEDETRALTPLWEIVEEGRTQADRLLAAYEGPWEGNINRLFEAEAL